MRQVLLFITLFIIETNSFSQPPPWAEFKDGKFHYNCWKDSADVTFDGFNGYTAANFFLNIDSSKVEADHGIKTFGLFTNWIDSRYDGKKWALVESDCKQLTPYVYDHIFPLKPYNSSRDLYFHPALFLACKDGKWGAISCQGKELVPCVYDLPFAQAKFGDCFFTVKEKVDCDLTKKISCPERMMLNGLFSYSMMGYNLIFLKNGKYGAVDTLGGKIILDFIYDQITFKRDGFYEAKKGKKTFTYTYNGVILPYDSIFISGTIYHRVLKNKKYGLIDEEGNVFVPCKYDTLSDLKYSSGDYIGEAELKGKEIDIKIAKNGEVTFTE